MSKKIQKIRLINKRNQIILRVALSIISIMVLSIIFFIFINKNRIDFNVNSGDSLHAEYKQGFNYDEVTANMCGNIFFKDGVKTEITYEGEIDASKLGTYTLKCQANSFLCTKEITVNIVVEDTTPPEITLITNPDNYTIPGQQYEEEGFKAVDNYDGDITANVTSLEHDGVVTYTATDSHGNTAKIDRQIKYNDPIPPEITLKGGSAITVALGKEYTDPGYTAIDNCDGDISDKVTIDGTVDINTPGDYVLTYSATDTYKNTATATRTVTVTKLVQSNTVNPGSKVVYLTFDDGPSRYTQQLLDILAKYNVKATFFTVNTGYTSMLANEAAAGHTVAIHSATHVYSQIYSSVDAYMSDLHTQEAIITSNTGIKPTLIRFPGGSSNTISRNYCSGIMSTLANVVESQGYQYFDWNVLSGDAGETTDTNTIIQNIISGISSHDVSIVLQHDIYEYSVNAVESVITWGLSNGYTFLPLDATSPKAHQHINN